MLWPTSLVSFVFFIDLHSYDLENNRWNAVLVAAGNPPTPRHSHAAIVYQDCMYIFGGKSQSSFSVSFHNLRFVSCKVMMVRIVVISIVFISLHVLGVQCMA